MDLSYALTDLLQLAYSAEKSAVTNGYRFSKKYFRGELKAVIMMWSRRRNRPKRVLIAGIIPTTLNIRLLTIYFALKMEMKDADRQMGEDCFAVNYL